MADTTDLDLFIGSKRSYEEFKKDKNIRVDEPEENESDGKPEKREVSTATELSKDTLTKIDDDTMVILKRTRCAHPYDEVYMQSSLEFYDDYYNDTEMSPELKAARQIRRTYKRYVDYLNALQVRSDYIDTIIDKHGGDDNFYRKLNMGMIKDWIPPMPILSKRSDDYELYLSGIIPVSSEMLPDGTVNDVLEAMNEDLSDVELDKSFDVETRIGVINNYEEFVDSMYESYGFNRRGGTVTVSDLEELNNIFKSWYKNDDKTETREMFKNAPENIRKRFLNYCSYTEPGLLARIANGGEIEEELPDMKELVHDPKTGKSMTRQELWEREQIRLLAKNGWSESRLLNYSNVGSTLERMSRKKKPSKKRKRPGNEFMDSMNSPDGLDPMYSENEYMSDAFMRLMNGED